MTHYFKVVLTNITGERVKRLPFVREVNADTVEQAESSILHMYRRFAMNGWSISIVELSHAIYLRECAMLHVAVDEAPIVDSMGCWNCDRRGYEDDCLVCGGKQSLCLHSAYGDEVAFEFLQDCVNGVVSRETIAFMPNGFYCLNDGEFLLTDSGAISVDSCRLSQIYDQLRELENIEAKRSGVSLISRVLGWVGLRGVA